MPWLAETDAGAAYGVARTMAGAGTQAELRFRALQALADLVPADVLTWDRVELATGAICHESLPAEAEPAGVFEALVGRAADHPLLIAHAARRRRARAAGGKAAGHEDRRLRSRPHPYSRARDEASAQSGAGPCCSCSRWRHRVTHVDDHYLQPRTPPGTT